MVTQKRQEWSAIRARRKVVTVSAFFDPEEGFEFQMTPVAPFLSDFGFRAKQIVSRGGNDGLRHVSGRRHALHSVEDDLSEVLCRPISFLVFTGSLQKRGEAIAIRIGDLGNHLKRAFPLVLRPVVVVFRQ